MTKREFLKAGMGTGLALATGATGCAQQAPAAARNDGGQPNRRPDSRMAKTTKLFKSPQGFPNGIAVVLLQIAVGERRSGDSRPGRRYAAIPKRAWMN